MPTSASRYNIITDLNPKSYISEAYRTLRTNIQFSTFDNHIRSIVVTSSEPSEGKSTTITNLAVAFAQEGKKVVLIDADLRKPTLHHYFMKSNRIGLSNLLAGQYTIQQAISDTHIENLSLISSGPVPPNPAEMLNSKRMEQQLQELKETYDIILMDTPPTLAVTDAQVLSAKCDGVVFVLNSGKVKRDTARKAMERLQHVNAKILGVVLNNKERNKNEGSYYYYYGSSEKE
ncbi:MULTISPECIES: CpsD/CapB family tyrosine-protein kinase [unclassified Paenibacillus]|uniref:CpsD/CapB family tyrosine-protein kinase n=1 Tax=unclassified Paenibacillus TaxID=185978 RepID=UPI001AE66BFF|nr:MULTISPECIES: CpsD/CapB family tyrosine-protein kinase [unclassified Paenibacillus]MBP1154387.1 capsular exopolysaccharide synthesis family protein [Paenibacillus sp. PvP091]MBP1170229.1 capsular exopolysaccharide synthesis family protein [Paenibacillus sp. PvR098]MBP2441257.1 capsular exopolysaccharide synthesis family protein [Paenibacillus sp. PvP052]